MHRLADVLTRAATGDFPEVDGAWERIEPWRAGVEGVLAFTGHALLAVGPDVTDGAIEALGADGFGGASGPRLVAGLAGSGWIDALDLVLVARGTGAARDAADRDESAALVSRNDLRNHPRAEHATSVRSNVATFGYAAPGDRTVVTLSHGLGGLLELGIETDPAARHTGAEVARDALTLIPRGEIVVAACAPGNARAIRAFLAAGFDPVASVQLWHPAR
ncbi:MAG: N-acetyltransferase [Dermatophilaceae bacterium]